MAHGPASVFGVTCIMTLTVLVAAAAAPIDRNARWCAGEDNATLAQKIKGCSMIIKRGRETPETRAAAYNTRGGAYYYQGKHQRAIRDYDQAIRLNPASAHAFNNRCWARAVVGRLEGALFDCDEALRLAPNVANEHENRAFVYLKMSQYDRAIADYDAAFKLEPNSADVLYGRGLAKLGKGDRTGGNADVEAGKKLKPWVVEEFARYGMKAP